MYNPCKSGFLITITCIKMNITNKANKLIETKSKTWLADKLGITRVTLDNRLKKSDWKKTETQMLISLSK